MNAEELSRLISIIFFGASTVAVLIFIVLYMMLTKWEKTIMGQHIFWFSVSTFAVLAQGLYGFANPGYSGQLIWRPSTYAAFFAVWVWRIWLFLADQRDIRRSKGQSIVRVVPEEEV